MIRFIKNTNHLVEGDASPQTNQGTQLLVSLSLVLGLFACSDSDTGIQTYSDPVQTSNVLRFEPNVIVDNTGFGQPMPAITLFTPMGWKASGGVEWGDQYACTKGFAFNWKITSQDELTGVTLLPQRGWEFNSRGVSDVVTLGCQIRPIYDVESYLMLVLQNVRPDATNIQFRPRPDLVAEIANNQWSRPWQMGMTHYSTEGGELIFNVVENGVTLDVRLAATVGFTKTVTNTGSYYNEAVTAFADPALATFAPQGEYDDALFTAMRKSATLNSQWQNAIAEHIRIINQTNINGAIARHKIKMNAYRDVSDMINQTWKNQQVSMDKRGEDFIDTIWEQQRFDDDTSASGQTKLSSHYEHAWRLEDGTYLMTDNHSFNPRQELGINGQRLNRSQ